MFKWIRNKILESFIKGIIKDLPEHKEKLKKLLAEKKDDVLEKVKETIKEKIRKLAEKA